mmetsp:Transcript_77775/g.157983  ORF Transcript_77775/g.157983 Transcript_77775/m.157983 type:complete len:85 (+) Transcript_77775:313-567(+)
MVAVVTTIATNSKSALLLGMSHKIQPSPELVPNFRPNGKNNTVTITRTTSPKMAENLFSFMLRLQSQVQQEVWRGFVRFEKPGN